jgi:glycosyltransferase involved in cell wall biosynthesis
MAELNELERIIYNEGERLIPGLTHDLEELIRHYSSYLFFRLIIMNDLAIATNNKAIDIIDLGCGVGWGCRVLSEITHSHISGVDISRDSLEYAHEHYMNTDIHYEQADLLEFIPRMPECDYAVSRNAIEHIPNGLRLAKSIKWRRRLIFDVPYGEPEGRNIYHVLTGITEEAFVGFDGVEIFYQDLSGCIYDAQHKPANPNIIICVCSSPDLPKLSDCKLGFDTSGRLYPMHHIKEQDCLYSLFPLVSIITPAYNRAAYLDETIQSVLAQNYPRIEYIVLNDGSTDNTEEVLQKYTGHLIWETHPNMGETRTVNKGFGMAHGEIVAVVNSDDPLLPGAVRAAVAFMQSYPDILVAYPDWDFIDRDSIVTRHVQVPEYNYLYSLRRHYYMVGPGAFIRRKAFELTGMRDSAFKYAGDFEYWLRLGLYGQFARIPRTLATFRVHPDSATVSQKGHDMADEHIRLTKQFYSRPGLPPRVLKVHSQALAWAYLTAGIACGRARWLALWYYLRAVLYHPTIVFSVLSLWLRVRISKLPRPIFRVLQWGWHMTYPILAKGR